MPKTILRMLAIATTLTAGFHCKTRTSNVELASGDQRQTQQQEPRADVVQAAESFTKCLKAHPEYDVGDAVQCLPKNCTFELARSNSLQRSCVMKVPAGCASPSNVSLDLPRVLARCNDRKLTVTWSFCVGGDHVEVGTPDGEGMYLWDIGLPLIDVLSLRPMEREGNGENCNTCHFTEFKDPFSYSTFPTAAKDLIPNSEELLDKLCAAFASQAEQPAGRCKASYNRKNVAREVDAARNLKLCRALLNYGRSR